jgi:hypothetical protein
LELTPNPTPPPSARLYHTRTLAHVREYVQTIHKLIPSTPIAPFDETTGIFRLFHPLVAVDIPPFIDDFHFETEVTLNQKTFVFALVCSPHLSSGGPLGMVYNYENGFNLFFKFSKYVGTLLKVMFHLQYHVCFLHIDF